MPGYCLFAAWLALVHCLPVCALEVDDRTERVSLGKNLWIYEDAGAAMTLDEVLASDVQGRFVQSGKDVPAFGFRPSAFWLRFEVVSRAKADSDWLLNLNYAPMQQVDVHVLHPAESSASCAGGVHPPLPGDQGGSCGQRMQGGSLVAMSQRPFAYRTHVFPLHLQAGERVTVLVRVQTSGSVTVPLTLWRAAPFAAHAILETYVFGAFAGVMVALALYHLCLFAFLKEGVYLYNVLFQVGATLAFAAVNGEGQMFLWPEWPRLGVTLIPVSVGLAGASSALFAISFLSSASLGGTWRRALKGIVLAGVLMACAALLLPYKWVVLVLMVYVMLGVVVLLGCGLQAWRSGLKAARYYLWAWGFFLAGTGVQVLRLLSVLQTSLWTEYALFSGVALEAVFFSVALASHMRDVKLQTQQLQRASLEAAKSYSRRLEAEVQARTSELVDMQQKLVVSEKMNALSVFTAGMAHEINNPANFISASVQTSVQQLHSFRDFVTDLMTEEADPDIAGAFDERFSKLESLNSVALEGVKRIEQVVKALRSAHPEGDVGRQPLDIVEALQSAWRVVRASLDDKVRMVINVTEAPVVSCSIAEINQVFFALLTNAGHAVTDAALTRGNDWEPCIGIDVSVSGSQAIIRVTDNGNGVGTDIRERIFDPFFTTREVGKGSGLGLSMARDVVAAHGGALRLVDRAEGACFEICLPL